MICSTSPFKPSFPPTLNAPDASASEAKQVQGSQFSDFAIQTPRLAPHPELDSYVLNNAQAPKSAAQFTAEMVKKQFKEKFGGVAASFIPGPVGAFVATMFATHGAIEVGEGLKDAIDGKPGAAKRIAFGALNAVPLVGRGIFKTVKAGKGPGK